MKEWLIRTKSHHILGPVSIEKLRELIANNSIKGDDEVCCGNGYWIFVREQELIKKYVFDGIKQDFNPVQEAEYVDINDYPLEENNSQLPSNEDLEYPDESLNKPSVEGTASTVIKKKTEKDGGRSGKQQEQASSAGGALLAWQAGKRWWWVVGVRRGRRLENRAGLGASGLGLGAWGLDYGGFVSTLK